MACSPSRFTVDWSIEDFSWYHLAKTSKVSSPTITIEEFDCEKLILGILPNERSYVGFGVYRVKKCEGPEQDGYRVYVNCEVSIKTYTNCFHILERFAFELSSRHNRTKLYESKLSIDQSKLEGLTNNYAPRGTLFVRFEFWKVLLTALCYGCSGVTNIGKENFSRILRFRLVEGTSGPVIEDIDTEIQTRSFLMKVDLEFQPGQDVYVTVKCHKQCPPFVAVVRIRWLDAEFGGHRWVEGKHFFKRHSEEWLFPHFLPKAILEEDKYLRNGVLSLYVSVSWGTGHVSSLVEEYHYPEQFKPREKTLDWYLYSLYKSLKFSDYILKSGRETYQVHKFILWARSSVFRVMLQSDMTERKTGVVHIDDLEGAPMRKFVRYLYCGYLKNSTDLEELEKLYWAADKYDLGSMKMACSKMLGNVLNVHNSLTVLVLADRHVDYTLKRMVQEFIAHHLDEFLLSPQWELFMEEPNKLGKELSQFLRSKEHRT